MIFLFFLRTNKHIKSLHARNINLKSDVIRILMKDFVNLREFTLSFAEGQSYVVGGGYSDVHNQQRHSIKRREVGSLLVSILDGWKQIEFLELEKVQLNAAQFSESHFYEKLHGSTLKHILIKDCYVYSTRLFSSQS